MSLPVPSLTASIVHGETTNRVNVAAPRGGKSKGRRPPRSQTRERQPSPARPGKRGWKADQASRGKGCKVICISIPIDELAALDRLAERTQMNRSHLLRQAAKHFAAYIGT